MTNSEPSQPDDQRIEKTLEAAAEQMAQPSADFFANLAQITTQAFLEEQGHGSDQVNHSGLGSIKQDRNPSDQPDSSSEFENAKDEPASPQNGPRRETISSQRNRPMFSLLTRVLAVGLSGIILFFVWSTYSTDDDTLGKVLDRSTATGSIAMRFESAEAQQNLLATRRQVRFQLSPTSYEIANADASWIVDEPTQRVFSAQPKYFGDDGQLNLLQLLSRVVGQHLSDTQLTSLRGLKPVRGQLDGVVFDIYETEIELTAGRCGVTAYVSPETGLLSELQFRRPTIALGDAPDRLMFLKYGQPIDKSQFALSKALTPVGQIAKVMEVEGQVWIRPIMQSRWTLASPHLVIEVGDQIRTGARGANATRIKLAGQGTLTLGPKSMLELVSANTLKLNYGDLEISPNESKTIEILDQNGDEATTKPIAKKTVLRRRKPSGDQTSQLTTVDQTPAWLSGLEENGHDPTGSLVATIDGRNVPLSVGYHKVDVDIRDQIARTVIEQSFVNNTNSQLEGVFYFPLPQDASISGFGMWINGELIEADVVEKQRAREIYETILREKRDPGLLEWTGGNIFKARVFPIDANSEKRIKITYTQVLPRRGNRYVYNYGLQSEMLTQTPLRQLDITAKVSSAVGIAEVEVPSHDARISVTAGAASVEFSAEEYTPERDFELAISVPDDAPPVTLIPHQSGSEGYFLVQLNTPEAKTLMPPAFDRDLVAEGRPIEVLIVADTSASMNASARKAQAEFVEALIGSLSRKDRVNTAVTDVHCQWQHEQSVPAGPESAKQAFDWLSSRPSLGWSDLDNSMDAILSRATAGTQVVYVGDGMVSTYQADPFGFTSRLKERAIDAGIIFHSVTVGSSYESTVQKALASIGGGSMRRVSADRPAGRVAGELVMHMASTTLEDLTIEFDGLRVAALYPEVLPNLPIGTQQILLGRYLPTGKQQSGTLKVSATKDGKPLQWNIPIDLNEAEKGNSFIPRLWARMHLDKLLAQGSDPDVQQRVIQLSEEFHIITPYTSLLVLESDEDRERFGVKRRFRMRDGEQFFADGRDNANYELLQKQIKSAGTWRVSLQRRLIQELQRQGRIPLQTPPVPVPFPQTQTFSTATYWHGGGQGGGSGEHWGIGGGGGGGGFGGGTSFRSSVTLDTLGLQSGQTRFFNGEGQPHSTVFLSDELVDSDFDEGFRRPTLRENERLGQIRFDGEETEASSGENLNILLADGRGGRFDGIANGFPGRSPAPALERFHWQPVHDPPEFSFSELELQRSIGPGYHPASLPFPNYQTLQSVPELPDRKSWNKEVRKLLNDVAQMKALRKLADGKFARTLHFESVTQNFEPVSGQTISQSSTQLLFRPNQWYHQATQLGNQPSIAQWHVDQQENVILPAYGLGQIRKPLKQLIPTVPREILEWTTAPFRTLNDETWEFTQKLQDGTIILRFTSKTNWQELHLNADSKRITKTRFGKGEQIQQVREFVGQQEVAGLWLPTEVKTYDQQGQLIRTDTLKLGLVDNSELKKTIANGHAADQTLWVKQRHGKELAEHRPLPHADALQREDATKEDHVYWINYFLSANRPRLAEQHLAALDKRAGKPQAMAWLQIHLFAQTRRFSNLQTTAQKLGKMIRENAAKVFVDDSATPFEKQDQLALADSLVSKLALLSPHEKLNQLKALKSVYDSFPEFPQQAKLRWLEQLANAYRQINPTLMLQSQKEIASLKTYDRHAQSNYAQQLANVSRLDDAIGHIRNVIASGPTWLSQKEKASWSKDDLLILEAMMIQFLYQKDDFAGMIEVAENAYKAQRYPQCQLYLDVLAQLGQQEKRNETLQRWLALIGSQRTQAELDAGSQPMDSSPINTALEVLAPRWNNQTIEARWLQPLLEAGLIASKDPATFGFAKRILQSNNFTRQPQGYQLRRTIGNQCLKNLSSIELSLLRLQIEYLPFAEKLSEKENSTTENWFQLVIEPLRLRWQNETDATAKSEFLNLLLSTMRRRGDKGAWLAMLENLFNDSTDKNRKARAQAFYDALKEEPWTIENETQLWQVAQATISEKHLSSQVTAVMRWVDDSISRRVKFELDKIEKPEQLSKRNLAAKRAEALKASQQALAQRLNGFTRENNVAWLQPWIDLEVAYLKSQSVRNIETKREVLETLWNVVGDTPISLFNPAENDLDDAIRKAYAEGNHNEVKELQRKQTELHQLYRLNIASQQRALIAIMYQLAMKSAAVEDQAKLLAHIRKGTELKSQPDADRWRLFEFQFRLVAGQIDAIQKRLAAWVKSTDRSHQWRQVIAILTAEAGDVVAAIKHFEFIQRLGLLEGADYQRLADWYMVIDERQKHEAAKRAYFDSISENQLYQIIQNENNRRPIGQLDQQIGLACESLLRRATQPQNYRWMLDQLYRKTKDFRVLTPIADSVIGHTPNTIYSILEAWTPTINNIQEEATIDAIQKRIRTLRLESQNDVDQRALDLLEASLEQRAGHLETGGDIHVKNAIQLLESVAKTSWRDGERTLMAKYLSGTRNHQDEVRNTLLRILEELHRGSLQEKTEYRDRARLETAASWARVLRAKSETKPKAILLLSVALDEYLERHPFTYNERDFVTSLMDDLQQERRFSDAESRLQRIQKTESDRANARWLNDQLNSNYVKSIRQRGRTSFSSGVRQYQQVRDHFILQLKKCKRDQDRIATVRTIVSLHRACGQVQEIKPTSDIDLKRFAFSDFSAIPFVQLLSRIEAAYALSDQVDADLGHEAALEFVTQFFETTPDGLTQGNQGYAENLISKLHAYRHRSQNASPILKQRVLNVISKRLEHSLLTLNQNMSAMRTNSSFFWNEKAGDYLKVAKRIWATKQDSLPHIRFISDYVGRGLRKPDQAVIMLETAYAEKKLDDQGVSLLIDMLRTNLSDERAVELLRERLATEQLAKRLADHTRLITSLSRLKRNDELLDAIKTADRWFNIPRFNEASLQSLARATMEAEEYRLAVPMLDRLIAKRRKKNPSADSTLRDYYQRLATCHTNLGNLDNALDAISAAIVVSDEKNQNRQSTLDQLNRLIARVADPKSAFQSSLQQLTERIEKQEAETGLSNYLLHKSIGIAYLSRKEFEAAIERFKVAVELQPNDREIHEFLIQCYLSIEETQQEIAQRLRLIQLFPREIQGYQSLSDRYLELDQPASSERALTSMVEMLPAETEGHAGLAQIRESQGRWDEATKHWRRVSQIRAKEPTGLIGLCRALIKSNQVSEAKKVLVELQSTQWPERFNIGTEIETLQKELQ